MKQRGQYAVLTTDFGLTVRYNWNMRLYISVPSSYYKHLGGLCGNYNGDRIDDLPTPGGKQRGEENIFFVGSFEVKIITKFKHMNKLINEDVTK